jgi:hypothetical protein
MRVTGLLALLVACLSAVAAMTSACRSAQPGARVAETGGSASHGEVDQVSTSSPICGVNNDVSPLVPADYTTFVPPPRGGSYVDAFTKCTVVRLTDSARDGAAAHHYYSTISPVNASDNYVMIDDEDWNWSVVDASGRTVVSGHSMPQPDGHIVWDAKDGNVFYYANGASIIKGTIQKNRIVHSTLYKFSEYGDITFMDAWDVSEDGDHLIVVGSNSAKTMDVFTFSISKLSKGGVYTTHCAAANPLGNQPGCLHKVQFDGANDILITFNDNGLSGETGAVIWNGQTVSRLQNSTTHFGAGLDASGHDVVILDRYSDGRDACPRGGGADLMRINPISSITCLFDKDWAAPHVSYGGGPQQPWAAISFFDNRTPGPEYFNSSKHFSAPTCTQTKDTTSGACWYPYESEVVLVRIDAENDPSKIYRMAQTRTRACEGYWGQPHASISRDGKVVVFDSNMAFAQKGCGGINNCSDVFLVHVR